MSVLELERKLVSYGKVVVLGAGRLGIRLIKQLAMTHRGGFREIVVFDGAFVEENDYYHILLGAEVNENKASFAARRFLTPDTRYRVFYPIAKDFSMKESDLRWVKGADVLVSTIAGGDTLSLVADVATYCEENAIAFITTNGVFGLGQEEILVFESLSEANVGPAVFLKELLKERSKDLNITLVGTGKLIKDGLPITPMILDRLADKMAFLALKALYDRRSE